LHLLEKIDLFFAKRVLKDFCDNENVEVFLAYLFGCFRAGHVCCRIEGERIFPSVKFLSEEKKRQPFLEKFRLTVLEGSKKIPSFLVANDPKEAFVQEPICYSEGRFYLQKSWFYEKFFLNSLDSFLEKNSSNLLDKDLFENFLHESEKEQKLSYEQRQALISLFDHPLTLVTGGPGTGKSYTAAFMISAFLKSFCRRESGQKCRVAIAAPTGKAANHLQAQVFSENFSDERLSLQVGTIHALLEMRKDKKSSFDVRIEADLVIIDEASMIDLPLFAHLFSALSAGTKLVLLGDKDQLGPIDFGMIFQDLLEGDISDHIGKVFLTKSLRFSGDLDLFANILRSKDRKQIETFWQKEREKVKFYQGYEAFEKKILSFIGRKIFFSSSNEKKDPSSLLHSLGKEVILSTLKEGYYGSDEINERIVRKILEKASYGDIVYFPLMITKNDYANGLYNGTMGVMEKRVGKRGVLSEADALDRVFFWEEGRSKGEILQIPLSRLHFYSMGFCLSVHKSQGSEFGHVMLLVPKGSERFGPEILYTASTRAKEELEIFTDREIFFGACMEKGERVSGVKCGKRVVQGG
jgi:exodeoxyribonuclease V alpha subunit